MRRSLVIHPARLICPIARFHVDVERPNPGTLSLSYYASGEIDDVLMPDWGAQSADPLWEHTCFEAFVRVGDEAGYIELNFSPSSRWAAYRFDDYRAGMRPAEDVDASDIETMASASHFELTARVELPGLPTDQPWKLGLAAVIEERNGEKSYWALAHPPGQPDFHHRDGFALELPAVTRA